MATTTAVSNKSAGNTASTATVLTSSAKEGWTIKTSRLTNGHYFIKRADLKAYLLGESTVIPIRAEHEAHGETNVTWQPSFYNDDSTGIKWFGDGSCLLWFKMKDFKSLLEFTGLQRGDVAKSLRQSLNEGYAAAVNQPVRFN